MTGTRCTIAAMSMKYIPQRARNITRGRTLAFLAWSCHGLHLPLNLCNLIGQELDEWVRGLLSSSYIAHHTGCIAYLSEITEVENIGESQVCLADVNGLVPFSP